MIIKTEHNEFTDWLTDASNYKGECDKIYFPESSEEAAGIISRCYRQDIKYTVSGRGTGLTGGRVPKGGIVISTDRLNKIVKINPAEKWAVTESGVVLSDLHEAVNELKLFYPPDPTEQNSSIGGNIANNASGAKTFKYGPTRSFVLWLEVILPDGGILHLGRGEYFVKDGMVSFITLSDKQIILNIPDIKMPDVKNASGFYMREGMDLIDLFIGSEGTLGLITKVKLKLLKIPEDFLSCVVFFEDEDNALNFIQDAAKLSKDHSSDIDALGLEFFDSRALEFLKADYPVIPDNIGAAVWFEQETNPDKEEVHLEKWTNLILKFNADIEKVWFASGREERKKFHEFRHAVSWKVSEYLVKAGLKKVGTDIAVPEGKFSEFFRFCKSEAINSGIKFISYGHFGNSHLHMNFLPKNESGLTEARKLYKLLCAKGVELGGTVSAEHGIGKIKREFLLMMYGEENIKKMASVKKQLDTKWLCGVGNIFSRDYL